MGTKYKGSHIEMCALNAFIALARSASALSSKFERELAEFDLSSGQFGVLEALYHLGSLQQKELGAKLLSSKGNITLIIDNLEKRELVERIVDKHDRRVTNVNLSQRGRALIKKIMPKHVKSITDCFSVLTEKEMELLRQVCKKVGCCARNQ